MNNVVANDSKPKRTPPLLINHDISRDIIGQTQIWVVEGVGRENSNDQPQQTEQVEDR
jgi:hypothetical protein